MYCLLAANTACQLLFITKRKSTLGSTAIPWSVQLPAYQGRVSVAPMIDTTRHQKKILGHEDIGKNTKHLNNQHKTTSQHKPIEQS